MKPYIETDQGYTLDHKSYVSQEKIAGTDWTVLGVSSLEKLDQVRSQLLWTLLGASVTSLLACLCLVLVQSQTLDCSFEGFERYHAGDCFW